MQLKSLRYIFVLCCFVPVAYAGGRRPTTSTTAEQAPRRRVTVSPVVKVFGEDSSSAGTSEKSDTSTSQESSTRRTTTTLTDAQKELVGRVVDRMKQANLFSDAWNNIDQKRLGLVCVLWEQALDGSTFEPTETSYNILAEAYKREGKSLTDNWVNDFRSSMGTTPLTIYAVGQYAAQNMRANQRLPIAPDIYLTLNPDPNKYSLRLSSIEGKLKLLDPSIADPGKWDVKRIRSLMNFEKILLEYTGSSKIKLSEYGELTDKAKELYRLVGAEVFAEGSVRYDPAKITSVVERARELANATKASNAEEIIRMAAEDGKTIDQLKQELLEKGFDVNQELEKADLQDLRKLVGDIETEGKTLEQIKEQIRAKGLPADGALAEQVARYAIRMELAQVALDMMPGEEYAAARFDLVDTYMALLETDPVRVDDFKNIVEPYLLPPPPPLEGSGAQAGEAQKTLTEYKQLLKDIGYSDTQIAEFLKNAMENNPSQVLEYVEREAAQVFEEGASLGELYKRLINAGLTTEAAARLILDLSAETKDKFQYSDRRGALSQVKAAIEANEMRNVVDDKISDLLKDSKLSDFKESLRLSDVLSVFSDDPKVQKLAALVSLSPDYADLKLVDVQSKLNELGGQTKTAWGIVDVGQAIAYEQALERFKHLFPEDLFTLDKSNPELYKDLKLEAQKMIFAENRDVFDITMDSPSAFVDAVVLEVEMRQSPTYAQGVEAREALRQVKDVIKTEYGSDNVRDYLDSHITSLLESDYLRDVKDVLRVNDLVLVFGDDLKMQKLSDLLRNSPDYGELKLAEFQSKLNELSGQTRSTWGIVDIGQVIVYEQTLDRFKGYYQDSELYEQLKNETKKIIFEGNVDPFVVPEGGAESVGAVNAIALEVGRRYGLVDVPGSPESLIAEGILKGESLGEVKEKLLTQLNEVEIKELFEKTPVEQLRILVDPLLKSSTSLDSFGSKLLIEGFSSAKVGEVINQLSIDQLSSFANNTLDPIYDGSQLDNLKQKLVESGFPSSKSEALLDRFVADKAAAIAYEMLPEGTFQERSALANSIDGTIKFLGVIDSDYLKADAYISLLNDQQKEIYQTKKIDAQIERITSEGKTIKSEALDTLLNRYNGLDSVEVTSDVYESLAKKYGISIPEVMQEFERRVGQELNAKGLSVGDFVSAGLEKGIFTGDAKAQAEAIKAITKEFADVSLFDVKGKIAERAYFDPTSIGLTEIGQLMTYERIWQDVELSGLDVDKTTFKEFMAQEIFREGQDALSRLTDLLNKSKANLAYMELRSKVPFLSVAELGGFLRSQGITDPSKIPAGNVGEWAEKSMPEWKRSQLLVDVALKAGVEQSAVLDKLSPEIKELLRERVGGEAYDSAERMNLFKMTYADVARDFVQQEVLSYLKDNAAEISLENLKFIVPSLSVGDPFNSALSLADWKNIAVESVAGVPLADIVGLTEQQVSSLKNAAALDHLRSTDPDHRKLWTAPFLDALMAIDSDLKTAIESGNYGMLDGSSVGSFYTQSGFYELIGSDRLKDATVEQFLRVVDYLPDDAKTQWKGSSESTQAFVDRIRDLGYETKSIGDLIKNNPEMAVHMFMLGTGGLERGASEALRSYVLNKELVDMKRGVSETKGLADIKSTLQNLNAFGVDTSSLKLIDLAKAIDPSILVAEAEPQRKFFGTSLIELEKMKQFLIESPELKELNLNEVQRRLVELRPSLSGQSWGVAEIGQLLAFDKVLADFNSKLPTALKFKPNELMAILDGADAFSDSNYVDGDLKSRLALLKGALDANLGDARLMAIELYRDLTKSDSRTRVPENAPEFIDALMVADKNFNEALVEGNADKARDIIRNYKEASLLGVLSKVGVNGALHDATVVQVVDLLKSLPKSPGDHFTWQGDAASTQELADRIVRDGMQFDRMSDVIQNNPELATHILMVAQDQLKTEPLKNYILNRIFVDGFVSEGGSISTIADIGTTLKALDAMGVKTSDLKLSDFVSATKPDLYNERQKTRFGQSWDIGQRIDATLPLLETSYLDIKLSDVPQKLREFRGTEGAGATWGVADVEKLLILEKVFTDVRRDSFPTLTRSELYAAVGGPEVFADGRFGASKINELTSKATTNVGLLSNQVTRFMQAAGPEKTVADLKNYIKSFGLSSAEANALAAEAILDRMSERLAVDIKTHAAGLHDTLTGLEVRSGLTQAFVNSLKAELAQDTTSKISDVMESKRAALVRDFVIERMVSEAKRFLKEELKIERPDIVNRDTVLKLLRQPSGYLQGTAALFDIVDPKTNQKMSSDPLFSDSMPVNLEVFLESARTGWMNIPASQGGLQPSEFLKYQEKKYSNAFAREIGTYTGCGAPCGAFGSYLDRPSFSDFSTEEKVALLDFMIEFDALSEEQKKAASDSIAKGEPSKLDRFKYSSLREAAADRLWKTGSATLDPAALEIIGYQPTEITEVIEKPITIGELVDRIITVEGLGDADPNTQKGEFKQYLETLDRSGNASDLIVKGINEKKPGSTITLDADTKKAISRISSIASLETYLKDRFSISDAEVKSQLPSVLLDYVAELVKNDLGKEGLEGLAEGETSAFTDITLESLKNEALKRAIDAAVTNPEQDLDKLIESQKKAVYADWIQRELLNKVNTLMTESGLDSIDSERMKQVLSKARGVFSEAALGRMLDVALGAGDYSLDTLKPTTLLSFIDTIVASNGKDFLAPDKFLKFTERLSGDMFERALAEYTGMTDKSRYISELLQGRTLANLLPSSDYGLNLREEAKKTLADFLNDPNLEKLKRFTYSSARQAALDVLWDKIKNGNPTTLADADYERLKSMGYQPAEIDSLKGQLGEYGYDRIKVGELVDHIVSTERLSDNLTDAKESFKATLDTFKADLGMLQLSDSTARDIANAAETMKAAEGTVYNATAQEALGRGVQPEEVRKALVAQGASPFVADFVTRKELVDRWASTTGLSGEALDRAKVYAQSLLPESLASLSTERFNQLGDAVSRLTPEIVNDPRKLAVEIITERIREGKPLTAVIATLTEGPSAELKKYGITDMAQVRMIGPEEVFDRIKAQIDERANKIADQAKRAEMVDRADVQLSQALLDMPTTAWDFANWDEAKVRETKDRINMIEKYVQDPAKNPEAMRFGVEGSTIEERIGNLAQDIAIEKGAYDRTTIEADIRKIIPEYQERQMPSTFDASIEVVAELPRLSNVMDMLPEADAVDWQKINDAARKSGITIKITEVDFNEFKSVKGTLARGDALSDRFANKISDAKKKAREALKIKDAQERKRVYKERMREARKFEKFRRAAKRRK